MTITTDVEETEVEPVDLSLIDEVLKKYERFFSNLSEQKAWKDWHEREGADRDSYHHLLGDEYLIGIRARVIYIGLHPFEDTANILEGKILHRRLFFSQDTLRIFRNLPENLQRFTFALALAEDTTLQCLSEEQRTSVLSRFSGISYLEVYLCVLKEERLVDLHNQAFDALVQLGQRALSSLCHTFQVPFSYKQRAIETLFLQAEIAEGEEKDKVQRSIAHSLSGVCDQLWYSKEHRTGSRYEYFLESLGLFLAAEPSGSCKSVFNNNGLVKLFQYLGASDQRREFGMWLFGGDWPHGPHYSMADYKAEFAPLSEEIALNFAKWAKEAREAEEHYRAQRAARDAKVARRLEIENAIKLPQFRKSE